MSLFSLTCRLSGEVDYSLQVIGLLVHTHFRQVTHINVVFKRTFL